jgi:hypothetical protein
MENVLRQAELRLEKMYAVPALLLAHNKKRPGTFSPGMMY